MPHLPRYHQYRPRQYIRRMPISWWVHKWVHMRFILRELTSVFVAFYAIMLVCYVQAIRAGPEAYAALLDWQETPLSIALHAVAAVMVLFHSISWFRLAPKAAVIRVGDRILPDWLIVGMNIGAWGFFSIVLAWLIVAS